MWVNRKTKGKQLRTQRDSDQGCWHLYILRCSDGSYYTGITTDLLNRLKMHNSGKGAKYTRQRRPVQLVYYEDCSSETLARRREHEVKSWRREKKEHLISGFPSERLADVLRISAQ